jgi:wyosine [tRNA(Phe)-imidazoG37] synthetase (radical SAM superfamily)
MAETKQKSEPVTKQTELAPVHDFAAKLCQPSVIDRLKEYVRWQIDWRRARDLGEGIDEHLAQVPDHVPLSINLDLTTACNYACDHCVDMDILNTGVQYDHARLMDSLTGMAQKGLRSVIVIGGGEPTSYPKFEESIRHMKALGLKLGIVTNGSGMAKIQAIADCLDAQDWVRLSLDSGSNEVFHAMHKPKGRMLTPSGKKEITLDEICEGVARCKEAYPKLRLGYSFIIVWKDCEANHAAIHENVHEIVLGAERAKRYGFDYISFKPFLTRAESNNAEIVGLTKQGNRIDDVMVEIRKQVDLAKKLETSSFKVLESTNLKVLENGTYRNYTQQPRHCHMQFFRQVVSPLGVFNCPVYRHVQKARIGEKHAYADAPSLAATQRSTLRIVETFDAREECKEVTCLYNHVNWFLEDLIEHPEKLDALEPSPERDDFFL